MKHSIKFKTNALFITEMFTFEFDLFEHHNQWIKEVES